MKLKRKLISIVRTLGFTFSSATNGAGSTANATNLSGAQKLLVGNRGVLFGADRVSVSIYDAAFLKKPDVDRLPLITRSEIKKFRLFQLQMSEKVHTSIGAL